MLSRAKLIGLLNLKSYKKWEEWVLHHLEEEIQKTGQVTFWYDYDSFKSIKEHFQPKIEKLGYTICYHSTFITITF